MKTIKILILIISILFAKKSFTQNVKEGEYTPNTKIDKFVGTWEWKSGNETFTIIIKKQYKLETATWQGYEVKYFKDVLTGWHSYTKNGRVVESSMDKKDLTFKTGIEAVENSTLYGGSVKESEYAYFSFKDITKKKSGEVKFELLPGKTDQAKWKLKGYSTVRLHTDPPIPKGFTVPTEVIMKKVK